MHFDETDSRRLGYAAGFLLAALAVLVLIPGIHVSLFDRDEGWYAEVCREMVQSGDWWTPRYLGSAWLAKPPLAYWLIASSYSLFGIGAWQGRIVSVLASAAVVVMVALIGARLCSRRAGIAAGVVFATAALPAIAGRMVLTDPVMLACTLAAVLLHERAAGDRHRTSRVRHAVACGYWALIGLGLLAKGPATPLFAGAFAVALAVVPERRQAIRDWRWWAWAPVAIVVAAPWYAAMALTQPEAFTAHLLGNGIVSRVLDPIEGHGGLPGYYLLVSAACLLPWTALVPSALAQAIGRRKDEAARLLVVWMAVPWVLLELTSTKLPHYVLPCYVPLAILVGRLLDRIAGQDASPAGMAPVVRRLLGAWGWTLVAASAACSIVALTYGDPRYRLPAAACTALFGAGIAVAAVLINRGRLAAAGFAVVSACIVFHTVLGWWLLPSLDPLWVSRRLAERLDAAAANGEPIFVCGYEEPSTFFYLGHSARVMALPAIRSVLASRASAVIALSDRALSELADAAPGTPSVDSVGRFKAGMDPNPVRGFSYVKGRTETVWIARVPAVSPSAGKRSPE
jgi:4-amino-4-deoxy-L-arabinose transferase-like glycosyltransferase